MNIFHQKTVLLFSCVLCLSLTVPPVLAGAAVGEPVFLSTYERQKGYKAAFFAGGCFWCLEPAFEELEGVVDVSVGYCGGSKETADYYLVSGGGTRHFETVRVVYDPELISYGGLLDVYWRFIDPTDDEGQYGDRGRHYSTVIFYLDSEQKKMAELSRRKLSETGKYENPIVTRILPATPFYLAEERHQNFFEKRFPVSK